MSSTNEAKIAQQLEASLAELDMQARQRVLRYLLQKQTSDGEAPQLDLPNPKTRKERLRGILKGRIHLYDGFKDPVDELFQEGLFPSRLATSLTPMYSYGWY